MTQNGPYPGPPSQPWSGGGDEPYREPADPWGDHEGGAHPADAWGGHPVSTPAGTPGPTTTYGHEPASSPRPVWAPPGPAPQRRRPHVTIVGIVVALTLLVCGGLGTTAWLLIRHVEPTPKAQVPAPMPSTLRPRTSDATRSGPNPAPSSTDARFVSRGQCVRNEGTADTPQMTISVCATGAYEVLSRFNGRTTGEADAEAKCAKVPNYTKWYFYDSDLDSLDFVLCLKER